MKLLQIFIVMLIGAIAVPAYATNQKIDKAIKELEKMKDVELTFSEKRNSATKIVYNTTYLIKFKNASKGKALMELFEKERENSVEATKSKSVYSLTFEDGGVRSTYILIQRDKEWSLSVTKNYSSGNRGHRDVSDSSDDSEYGIPLPVNVNIGIGCNGEKPDEIQLMAMSQDVSCLTDELRDSLTQLEQSMRELRNQLSAIMTE